MLRQTAASRWWWVTALVYPVGLATGDTVLSLLPAHRRDAWLGYATTSVTNLVDHPLGALVTSGFVSGGDSAGYALLGLLGLGVLGWALGAWRSALIVLAAHVVGTYLSEGLVAVRILMGRLPDSDSMLMDVGPSYVVAGALAAGVAYGGRTGRVLCAVALAALAPSMFEGLTDLEVAAVGHACAIAVAVAVGAPLARAARRARAVPPGASTAFGDQAGG